MSVRNAPARHRPSAIDVFLAGRPKLRQAAEQWAADLGMTVVDLLSKLTDAGCRTSKSAAARWRVKY